MKNLLIILFIVPFLVFGQSSKDNQANELEKLNEYLFTEYVLKKNTQPINEIAKEDFILIAAPGMIESKKQVIQGVDNLNISSLKVTVDKVIETENIGIVIGVLEMQGTIMNRPVPSKIRYASTFVKQDGTWRLQSRTMTPMMRMKQ